jgi:hypothetical protein
MDTNTLNYELYLAPMAFAYNASFHRTISSTPFKVTYRHMGKMQEPLTLNQNNSKEKIYPQNYFKGCKFAKQTGP